MPGDAWSASELDILHSYFDTQATIITLHTRLQKNGYQRTVDSIRNKLFDLRKKGGFERRRETTERSLRVGYLDIEATNLNADFGFMLCWYIKAAGQNKYYHSIITRDEIHSEKFDRRVVDELLDALTHFDKVFAHYGGDRRFDLPYIRTRALMNGLGKKLARVQDERFVGDTWLISRNKLKLSSNSLDRLATILPGVKSKKTRLEPKIWLRGMVGNTKALAYIAQHCKADVLTLEQVHQELGPVERKTYIRMV